MAYHGFSKSLTNFSKSSPVDIGSGMGDAFHALDWKICPERQVQVPSETVDVKNQPYSFQGETASWEGYPKAHHSHGVFFMFIECFWHMM